MGICDQFYTSQTTESVAAEKPQFAILPIGAFEQHGGHLPLVTDSLIAGAIARSIHDQMGGLLLPPLPISCSHEHHGFAGSVWVSSRTLFSIIEDIYLSLLMQKIRWLCIVNGHGGNYVLANAVQELNLRCGAAPGRPENGGVFMGPSRRHWELAIHEAKVEKSLSEDMHGGEIETSILMCVAPESVGDCRLDVAGDDRRFMGLYGLRAHSQTGVVGTPSLATAEKGKALLCSLAASIGADMQQAMNGVHIDAGGSKLTGC